MRLSIRSLTAAALLGLAALSSISSAIAQTSTRPAFRMPAALPGGQSVPGTALVGDSAATVAASPVRQATPPFGLASPYGLATLTANPYAGGAPYSNPYNPSGYDQSGSDLSGVADVTQANAQYRVIIQQARLVQSQADMSRLDVRRRLLEEARYERLLTPTPEEVRRADIRADLNRARHEPPLTEIWSAKALNDIYRHLADELGKADKGRRLPDVPLDEDVLKHVNLTAGAGGSVGVLKDDGKLQWPLPLLGNEFQAERKRLERNTSEIVQRLKFGNSPEASTLKDVQADLNQLNGTLTRSAAELSPSQFIEAKRYVNQLEEALKALHNPNVANFFTRKWVAEGRTVADLVKGMADKGLRFAPAAAGDEPAYRVLYQALNSFDAAMAPRFDAAAK